MEVNKYLQKSTVKLFSRWSKFFFCRKYFKPISIYVNSTMITTIFRYIYDINKTIFISTMNSTHILKQLSIKKDTIPNQ